MTSTEPIRLHEPNRIRLLNQHGDIVVDVDYDESSPDRLIWQGRLFRFHATSMADMQWTAHYIEEPTLNLGASRAERIEAAARKLDRYFLEARYDGGKNACIHLEDFGELRDLLGLRPRTYEEMSNPT